jgi:hypothetical protein
MSDHDRTDSDRLEDIIEVLSDILDALEAPSRDQLIAMFIQGMFASGCYTEYPDMISDANVLADKVIERRG